MARQRDGRRLAVDVLCGLLLVTTLGACRSDEPARVAEEPTATTNRVESFCGAYEAMLTAQEDWTIEYLSGLSAREDEANEAEQAAAARPVRELMPDQFTDDWDEVSAVGQRLQDSIDELRPEGGTLRGVLADVRSRGFGSISEFVFTEGIEVDGRTWTFAEYQDAGAASAEAIQAFCNQEGATAP